MDERETPGRRPTLDEAREHERRQRFELLHHVSAFLEPLMIGLGFVFLILLAMDYASVPLVVLGVNRLGDILQLIWAIFLVDFLLRFIIAPEKVPFLRANWLGALSLALPFLRPLRAFRAARVVRGTSLVRLLGGLNRGMRIMRRVTRGRQFAFVGGLTLLVVLAGAVGVRYFDRGMQESPIQSFGDALWWSATLVTTIDSELHVASTEARIIALLQRIYALSIFGYITASIASYFIGVDAENAGRERGDTSLLFEVKALREEIAVLRQAGDWPEPPTSPQER